jgi:hypothetical protein
MLHVITNLVPMTIATAFQTVPDNGITGLLVGGGILSLAVYARFLKNRKK